MNAQIVNQVSDTIAQQAAAANIEIEGLEGVINLGGEYRCQDLGMKLSQKTGNYTGQLKVNNKQILLIAGTETISSVSKLPKQKKSKVQAAWYGR